MVYVFLRLQSVYLDELIYGKEKVGLSIIEQMSVEICMGIQNPGNKAFSKRTCIHLSLAAGFTVCLFTVQALMSFEDK